MLAGRPLVDRATSLPVRWLEHAIHHGDRGRAAHRPRHSACALARVHPRPGPRLPPPRRGPSGRARALAPGICRAADPRRVAGAPPADGPARRFADAVEERRDAAYRPPGRRRVRGPRQLLERPSRCRGCPHRRRHPALADRGPDAPARNRRVLSGGDRRARPRDRRANHAVRGRARLRLARSGLTGRLLVGTSGFSYPDWTPRFYPPGTRAADRLAVYASRLPALELHATFRRRPTPSSIAGWVRATPPEFRFSTVAQRGSIVRALWGPPEESIAWLTGPLHHFG